MLCDLLVHVSGNETGRQRVALAAELAKHVGAHLRGVHIQPPPEIAPLYKQSQVEAAVTLLSSELSDASLSARAAFDDATIAERVTTSWFEAKGDVAESVSHCARFADLVILGQDEFQDPPEKHPLPIAHSVVLMCGRPVLVVPQGAQTLLPTKVAIAWDGSREAVRAVHDAIPLLKLAKVVHIVAILRPSAESKVAQAPDLIGHLSHHGITATEDIEYVDWSDESAELRKFINSGGFDLTVMDGYSHPKWLEFLVGGTTMSTLLTSNISVLVSH